MLTEGSTGDLQGGGSLLRQAIYLALFGLTLANLKRPVTVQALAVVPFSIVAVLLWSVMSLTWSINPGVTVRRLVLTSLIVYTIFLLVSQSSPERVCKTIRLVLAIVTIANYAAVIIAPWWAIHQSATEDDPSIVGSWKGVLGQKNAAGAVCAMTVIFFLLGKPSFNQVLRWLIVVAASYFLYRTNSKTSMALFAASIAIAAVFGIYRTYYRIVTLMVLFLSAGIAGIVCSEYWNILSAPFYNQEFLTGRGQIWIFLMRYSQDHLFLGTGFGSFWNVGDVSPIGSYTTGWVSRIASGHNGFLDLLTQIGLPGLALAFWAVFLRPFSQLMSFPFDKRIGKLIVACIWFSVWHNLTESSLFNRDEAVESFLMVGIALMWSETRSAALNSVLTHKLAGTQLPETRELS